LLASLLVAADKTPDGRHAIRAAAALAKATGASLTVVEVVRLSAEGQVPTGRLASSRDPGSGTPELTSFRAWVGHLESEPSRTEIAVAYGVPGIEIGRVADERGADLVVLGRRPRSSDHPLILGETADALARRSPRPVLFIPPSIQTVRAITVALDGTERTASLIKPTAILAGAFGASVTAITVGHQESPPNPERIRQLLARTPRVPDPLPLVVRTGDPIVEILGHLEETNPDLLVIGYRRGGPPKVIGPADIARNLLYSAPSAVLTVPI